MTTLIGRWFRLCLYLGILFFCTLTGKLWAQSNPIVFNDNAGWCWYQDERAIITNNKLIFGSIGDSSGTGGSSRNGDVEVTTYDLSTLSLSKFLLKDNIESGDDHDAPAFLVRPDGKILAVYCRHGGDSLVRYRITSSAGDTSSWSTEQTFNVSSNYGATYENLYRLSSTGITYDFYRGQDYNPNVLVSSDDGSTWNIGGRLIRTGVGTRPYAKYASNNTDKVWFTYTDGHPDEVTISNIYVAYLQGSNIYNSYGTQIGVLDTTDSSGITPSQGTKIYNADSTHHAWTSDMQLDSNGYPVLAYTVRIGANGSGGSDSRYRYSRFDGATWHDYEIAYAGSCLYSSQPSYTGLITLNPSDPNTVYISTNANPVTGAALISSADGQRHWEVYRGFTNDNGASWTWTPITANSTTDNIRPNLPVWDSQHTALLWMKGTYTSYTNYNTDAVGYVFEGANGIWSNTSGGDWTNNGNWRSGLIAQGKLGIADFSALDVSGTVSVQLNDAQTLGTLVFGDANTATPGNWVLDPSAGGSLTLENIGAARPVITVQNQSASINVSLGGAQGVDIKGNGTLILGATNTYSGGTTIYSGVTLQVDDGGALPTEGAIVNNSTLVFNRSGTVTVNGDISGIGALTQNGSGAVVLGGANTYTGDTTITAGMIKLGSASGSMSPYSTVAMSANTTLDVTNVPSTLGALSGSSGAASVLIGSAMLTIGGNSKSTSFSGIISGSGGLVKIGSGVQTLLGNNTYEGGTTFNGGYLAVSALSKLGTGALTFNGGGLKFTSSFDPTLRPITINSGGAAFDTNNLSITFSNPLAGSGGVTKIGSGSLAYQSPCTYASDTIINAGSLKTYAANLLPNGSGKGNVTIAPDATLDLSGYNQTINGLSGQGTVDNTSGTSTYILSVGGNDTSSTFEGKAQNTTGSLGINKIGAGTFTLTGPNTYNGPTTITQGTLKLGVPVTVAHRWSFNNNLLDSVGGSNATVVDVGTNNTTFTPTYTQITLTGGARNSSDYVRLGTNLLPDTNTPVTIELWATPKSIQNWSCIFDFGADASEYLEMRWTKGVALTTDRVEWKDADTNTSDNTNQPYNLDTEYHIVMVLNPLADSTTEVKWYSAPSANADLDSAKGSFITTNNLANFLDSEDNLGRSFYSADNTANASYNEVRFWSGPMNSAILEALHDAGPNGNLNALSAGGSLPAATAVDITGSGAVLDLNNINQTIGSLSGVSGSSVLLGAATLTTGGNGGSTTFAGVISGSGSLNKTGAGTMTIAGANSFAGPTTIYNGTLKLASSGSLACNLIDIRTGAFDVSENTGYTLGAGKTIKGNGAIDGAVTVMGTVSPGESPGLLTVDNITFGNGSLLNIEVAGTAPGTFYDVLNSTGTVSLLTGSKLKLLFIEGFSPNEGDVFDILNFSGLIGTFSVLDLPALNSSLDWYTDNLYSDGTLSVVPEPATWLLVVLGATSLLFYKRRRK